MPPQFPQNDIKPGPSLTLLDHYKITLGRAGHTVRDLPDCLFFTFAGDILGSSGEHYEKGKKTAFSQAVLRASHDFSDDFMESLVMFLMKDHSYETTPESLMRARDDFYRHIKTHFESCAMTYSPWFKPLFDAPDIPSFLKVIAQHASCGAAMRACVPGASGLSAEKALPLFLCSHAHPEAIEGAYLIFGLARTLSQKDGLHFESAMEESFAYADWGRGAATAFLESHGMPPQTPSPTLHSLWTRVQESKDPYATIENIADEGIETRFVVPAALWLVHQAEPLPASAAIEHVVEHALEIGGDPDTICSIAMGILGLLKGKQAYDALAQVSLQQTEPPASHPA